jgi:hypothetical protein
MVGNDPLQLSPRRSFAAWSEIVRGTALPWTAWRADLALGRAIGVALVDIIVQVQRGAAADGRAPAGTNASLAAMDIADAAGGPTVAPLLAELEASAHRAAALYTQLQRFSG